jgi:hypothetical protein
MATETPARFKPLIDAVVSDPERRWDQSTRTPSTATTDANCVLEALLAEVGVDAEVAAVRNQGFNGDLRYVIDPLYREAIKRRKVRVRHSSS